MLPDFDFTGFAGEKYRPLLCAYFRFLQMGRKAFTAQNIPTEVRKEKLRLLEKNIRRECKISGNILTFLQQSFVKENLSVCLLLEPLTVWKYSAEDKFPTSEKQFSDIISGEFSPAARLIMVLNNENPSTYFPMTSLLMLFALQREIMNDGVLLKKAKISRRQRESRLRGLYKNAAVILALVRSKKLKFRLAVALNTALIRTERYTRNKHFSTGFLDCVRVMLYSICQFLFIKRRTVTKKGI